MSDRIEQLRKLLDAEPNDTFCMYGLALEYAKRGEHEAAVEWFSNTIDTDPAYCYAYFHMAKSQNDAGDRSGAIATLERGLVAARKAGDFKAASEIEALRDEWEI